MFLFLHPHSSPPHFSTSAVCAVVTSELLQKPSEDQALWYYVTGKKSHRAKKLRHPSLSRLFSAFLILEFCCIPAVAFMCRVSTCSALIPKQNRWFWKIAQWCIINQRFLIHLCTQEAVSLLTVPVVLFLLLATSVHPFSVSAHH